MLRSVFLGVLMVFVVLIAGSVVLEQFPSLVPVWEQAKEHGGDLYNLSLNKFGPTGTGLLIIILTILIGTSTKMGKR